MKKIYGDYEYEQTPAIPKGTRKTWLYRILKNKKTFYFRFEVSESIEKADLITDRMKTAIKTEGESLVREFLDQGREESGTWLLEPREPIIVLAGDWPEQSA